MGSTPKARFVLPSAFAGSAVLRTVVGERSLTVSQPSKKM